MTIGERIQLCRKQLELSQEDLGQKLLVSRQTISLWEKDQTVPTIDNLIRLKEIFGVSVDEMLGLAHTEQNNEILPNEAYRFTFSKEECKEIYRLQRRSFYKKPIIFTLICVFLIASLIGISAPAILVGFAFGILFIGATFHIKGIFTYNKVLKRSIERICESTYEYKVFENYLCINIYRQNERIHEFKCYFADIEQLQLLGKWLLLQFGGQTFIIREGDLHESSAIYSYMHNNPSKTLKPLIHDKWDIICETSNIVLSVMYVLWGWVFSFLGIMFFSLGSPDEPFKAICHYCSSALLLLTPIFCILGIVFSVLFRKKKAYVASFIIQFSPFLTLGIAVVLFFLSVLMI